MSASDLTTLILNMNDFGRHLSTCDPDAPARIEEFIGDPLISLMTVCGQDKNSYVLLDDVLHLIDDDDPVEETKHRVYELLKKSGLAYCIANEPMSSLGDIAVHPLLNINAGSAPYIYMHPHDVRILYLLTAGKKTDRLCRALRDMCDIVKANK